SPTHIVVDNPVLSIACSDKSCSSSHKFCNFNSCSCKNSCICSGRSSLLINTKFTSLYFSWACCKTGISRRQGGHQVAHKLITVGFPWYWSVGSAVFSLIFAAKDKGLSCFKCDISYQLRGLSFQGCIQINPPPITKAPIANACAIPANNARRRKNSHSSAKP